MPSSSPEAYPFLTAIGTMAIAWKGNRVVGTFLPEADEENLLKAVRRRLRTPRLIWAKNAPELVVPPLLHFPYK